MMSAQISLTIKYQARSLPAQRRIHHWTRGSDLQLHNKVHPKLFVPTSNEVFTSEDTDMDANTLLIEIYKSVKQLNNKFDSLEKAVKNLEKDNTHLKKQNKELTEQVSSLTEKLNTMEDKLTASSKRHEHL